MATLSSPSRFARPTRATCIAAGLTVVVVLFTATYLALRYEALPHILAVRFSQAGIPIGWQFKTEVRVFVPVLVQIALALALGAVGMLLLSRPRHAGSHPEAEDAPDVRAAAAAAEAVVLIAFIWVVFQACAAASLIRMWGTERDGLGRWYTFLEVVGVLMTCGVAVRAHVQFGRPEPRPFVPEHWRLGQLYKNPGDPALFVPTRDGRRWTLNFGRPVAAALLGLILLLGAVVPVAILGLVLRGT